MRSERLYLQDILEATETIAFFVSGLSKEAFLGDSLVFSAVAYQLMVIGEAAAHVSGETRARHPEIEWRDIVAFRNIIVHSYFATDESIVWTTAVYNAPELREQIRTILALEYPEVD